MPLIQGYEDAGDFTMIERLKTSIHVNLIFYLIVGSIGLFGLILVITMHKDWFVSSSLDSNFFSFYAYFLLLIRHVIGLNMFLGLINGKYNAFGIG